MTYFRLDGEGRITETLYPLNDPTGCYRSLEMYILSKDLLLAVFDLRALLNADAPEEDGVLHRALDGASVGHQAVAAGAVGVDVGGCVVELVDECMSHDLCSFRGAVLQAKAGSLNIRTK